MASSGGPKLLVVDDEPDVLSATVGYLRAVLPSVEAIAVPGADQAVRVLESQRIDMVLSDYKMPERDGLSLLAEVRRRWPEIPTVLFTAYPDMQVAIAALNDGHIRQFLTKPVDAQKLKQIVLELTTEKRTRESRETALQRAANVKAVEGPPNRKS